MGCPLLPLLEHLYFLNQRILMAVDFLSLLALVLELLLQPVNALLLDEVMVGRQTGLLYRAAAWGWYS